MDNLVKLTRYEDGTDRCPACGAIVPGDEQLEGGGILRRAVEHTKWCPTHRTLSSPPAPGVYTLAEMPPAAGPIWTNGLAETDYTEDELRRARRLLEHFHKELGQQWSWACLHYLTQTYRETGLDRDAAALLHLIAEEIHG